MSRKLQEPHYYSLSLRNRNDDFFKEGPSFLTVGGRFSPFFEFTKDFTISFWMISHLNRNASLIDGSGLYKIKLQQSKRNLQAMFVELCIQNAEGLISRQCFKSKDVVEAGRWNHFSFSFHYSTNLSSISFVKIFVNGVLNKQAIPDFHISLEDWNRNNILKRNETTNQQPVLLIGSASETGSELLFGNFDDISFWNRSFNDKELEKFVYNVFSGFEPNLVAFYSFNNDPNEMLIKDFSKNKLNANPTGGAILEDALYKPFVTATRCD